MSLDFLEHAARAFEPKTDPFPTPGALAQAITPGTIQTPALDVIDQALVDVEAGKIDRLIISMPPQEGKSTRVTKTGPLWFLLRNPDRRIVVASYAESLAQEFGRDIRRFITENNGADGSLDLGLRIAPDNGAVTAWQLAGRRGGVRSVGIAGGLTGRPADVLFIDDPISNMEQAESETYRERAWSFWTSVGRTRLAPGAPVILILTRWHHDDLAGRLIASEEGHRWHVINIPAQADYDPDAGETDPLGRQPGEWMQSARRDEKTGRQRSAEDWERTRREVGPRVWNALYQGRPTADKGNLFPKDWARYDQPLWIDRADGSRWLPGEGHEMAISADLTFKDKPTSDYVVLQVWARIGVDVYLLDQVRRRMNFNDTVTALKALAARWPQAVAKFVEDKANGPAVINALQSTMPGLIPVEPQGSKYARASAVSPLAHAGNVVLPDATLAPWVEDFVEEAKAFPSGAHDDQVDAMSQAVNQLLLYPLLEEETVTAEDLIDDDPHAYLGGY
ncbi:terminase [Xylanimonas oleitrophica]|uniref:Terminase n=1 Tax=Xylanimonas oleitrophica TaxID=2607479 RepID=A0A2W5X456_9MICO|nr:phage terminase large subunit [Xylanimonas oleitrophica]PZR55235.1 terminase [Xylanimonas oleitrophica]